MNIIGHGIDMTPVARIAEMVQKYDARFLNRIYTVAEQAYAAENDKRRFEKLAARFAAKEAALKALGTGWVDGIAWTDIEVVRQPSGQPTLNVTGKAAQIAASMNITNWHISLTHTDDLAMASVIAMSD